LRSFGEYIRRYPGGRKHATRHRIAIVQYRGIYCFALDRIFRSFSTGNPPREYFSEEALVA
jgi:hypothetical protein